MVTVAGDYVQEAIARVYRRYQETLEQRRQIDYPDLIRLAVKLLEENEDARQHYQELTRHLLVDELQDTGLSQYRLVALLGGRYRNVFAVGSPAQGIYGWRGADPAEMVSRFTQLFPDARVLVLRQHYRSTCTLLAASRAVGEGYPDADLWTNNPAGAPVTVVRVADEAEEARFVADTALDLHEGQGLAWSGMAVLFRVRRQATPLEQLLLQRRVPYRLTAGSPFFRQRDVRHLVAYLRLARDPLDGRSLAAILNVPPRGIGAATRKKLMGDEPCLEPWMICNAENREDLRPEARAGLQWLADFINDRLPVQAAEMAPRELLAYVIEETGYSQMIDDALEAHQRRTTVRELLALAGRYDELAAFLGRVEELEGETVTDQEGVVLSTIHQIKGLEFPVVFVVGMEEGLLPWGRAGGRDEEERRLFYVAITRARDRLFLIHARSRRDYQGRVTRAELAPSPFLRLLPRELTERVRLD